MYKAMLSGAHVDLLDPCPSTNHLEDIVHGLANICRYDGQCSRFYSVAEHSVLVSYLVPDEYAFEGLMHDAHEAFTGDMITPIKRVLGHVWDQFESRFERVVRQRFGLDPVTSDIVHDIDKRISAWDERLEMLPNETSSWGIQGGSVGAVFRHWNPGMAEAAFLHRFDQLAPAEHRREKIAA